MTSNDDFVRQLEKYLDEHEGSTPLPDAVREAVRAELPLTKQAGPRRAPARYMTMMFGKTAIAMAAAAAIVVIAIGTMFLRLPSVGPPPAPTPSPSVAATATAAADSCQSAAAEATGTGEITVTWCAYGVGEPAVTFRMNAPEVWIDQVHPGPGTLWLRPDGGGAIAFRLDETLSADEMLTDLTATPEYAVENRGPADLGGAVGEVFDVRLAPGASQADAPPLIQDENQSWLLQDAVATRAWVVDLDGEALLIAAGGEMADDVAAALETIEWLSD